MTEDTRRAIAIIKPIADELDIEVMATDSTLYMNGQAIGIYANSTRATLMEMIGYIFKEMYITRFRHVNISRLELEHSIMRYWLKSAAMNEEDTL